MSPTPNEVLGALATEIREVVGPLGALAYELLTVCRALQTVSTDANPSKAEAAGFVRERWPAWAPLIDAALACRRSGGRLGFDDKTSRDAVRRFIGEMADEVATIRRASPR